MRLFPSFDESLKSTLAWTLDLIEIRIWLKVRYRNWNLIRNSFLETWICAKNLYQQRKAGRDYCQSCQCDADATNLITNSASLRNLAQFCNQFCSINATHRKNLHEKWSKSSSRCSPDLRFPKLAPFNRVDRWECDADWSMSEHMQKQLRIRGSHTLQHYTQPEETTITPMCANKNPPNSCRHEATETEQCPPVQLAENRVTVGRLNFCTWFGGHTGLSGFQTIRITLLNQNGMSNLGRGEQRLMLKIEEEWLARLDHFVESDSWIVWTILDGRDVGRIVVKRRPQRLTCFT